MSNDIEQKANPELKRNVNEPMNLTWKSEWRLKVHANCWCAFEINLSKLLLNGVHADLFRDIAVDLTMIELQFIFYENSPVFLSETQWTLIVLLFLYT